MFTSIIEFFTHLIISFINQTSYLGIFFLMLAESACIPIPSEIIMPFSGFAVASGNLDFLKVVIAGTLGNLAGSVLAYFVGSLKGYSFLERYGKYFLISKKDLQKSQEFFEKYGQATVFFSRLLPIIRTFISLPAGVAKMNFQKFVLYTSVGSFIWSAFLVFLGIKMGSKWSLILDYFHKFDLLVGVVLMSGIVFYIWSHLKKLKEE